MTIFTKLPSSEIVSAKSTFVTAVPESELMPNVFAVVSRSSFMFILLVLPTPAIVKTPDAPDKVTPVPKESVLTATVDNVVPLKVKLVLPPTIFVSVEYNIWFAVVVAGYVAVVATQLVPSALKMVPVPVAVLG